jgi:rubrerythrin
MNKHTSEFLCQALETELGGVQVYTTALTCVQNAELKEEWQKYLEETREHVRIYTDLLTELGVDPDAESPGRQIVRNKGKGLVDAMKLALGAGDKQAAEIVAAECIVEAEAKCHLNWELVGELAKNLKGDAAKQLKAAYAEVEDQEDEHLYHTTGWARELWIKRLGMPAVLPPPEEEKDVKTAIGAARAKQGREEMLEG